MNVLKFITIFFVCFLFAVRGMAQGYVIKGNVIPDVSRIMLTKLNDQGEQDTLQVITPKNGKFRVKGLMGEPGVCFLVVEGCKGRIPVLLENETFKIDIKKGDLADSRNFTVKGGKYQRILNEFYQKERTCLKTGILF